MYTLDAVTSPDVYIVRDAEGREFVRVSRSNPPAVVLEYFGIASE